MRTEAGMEARRLRDREYRQAEYQSETPEGQRNLNLSRRYGITLPEWEALFEAQGRKCYFGCTETTGKNWSTDHDHETGQVRAILCHRHNVAVGLVESFKEDLAEMLEYVAQHKEMVSL